ncbi:hypothetical protein [Caballeronia sp. LZ034LL]|uniref:hypothetical protein n=1 Tax=Caballeronia sp. LZ034LL TaxID=3038567 RepID=UPI002855AB47|nr:hypothetical protein [Caballeronia sp. LZ034LL]MDR5834854.1 hypothetical protein [Caballeronia sp. LZ034LL]
MLALDARAASFAAKPALKETASRTAPGQPNFFYAGKPTAPAQGAGAASTTQDLVQITSVGTKYSGHPRSLKNFFLLHWD